MPTASDDQASFWSRREFQSGRSVDLFCRRFEDWWRTPQRVSIEAMLVGAETSIRDELTRELIVVEWQLRLKTGESPARIDYVTRFPSISELFERIGVAIAFGRDYRCLITLRE